MQRNFPGTRKAITPAVLAGLSMPVIAQQGDDAIGEVVVTGSFIRGTPFRFSTVSGLNSLPTDWVAPIAHRMVCRISTSRMRLAHLAAPYPRHGTSMVR